MSKNNISLLLVLITMGVMYHACTSGPEEKPYKENAKVTSKMVNPEKVKITYTDKEKENVLRKLSIQLDSALVAFPILKEKYSGIIFVWKGKPSFEETIFINDEGFIKNDSVCPLEVCVVPDMLKGKLGLVNFGKYFVSYASKQIVISESFLMTTKNFNTKPLYEKINRALLKETEKNVVNKDTLSNSPLISILKYLRGDYDYDPLIERVLGKNKEYLAEDSEK